MRRAITRTAYAPAQWVGVSQDISDAYAALTAAEVSPDLAREIVQAAGDRCNTLRPAVGRTSLRPDGLAFQRALVEETSSRFTTDATLGRGPAHPRIVALVGPPGSGKTTYPGETRRELRSGRPPAYPAALHGHASRRGRRPVAFLCRHPRCRFSVARDRVLAGPGDRGKPREGTDLHRYPGLRLRRPDRTRRVWLTFLPRVPISIRTSSCRRP